MALKGSRELRARLKAIRGVFKPLGRDWADETVKLAKMRVRVKTGKTRQSIRRRNASQRKAAVQATGGARFLEAGTKPHAIEPRRFRAMRFNAGGRTVFAKRTNHPGGAKRPFLRNSGRDALKKAGPLQAVLKQWNEAA